MTAREFGPIETAPASLHPPYTEHRTATKDEKSRALREALRGIPLGEFDAWVAQWLSGWDTATSATVVSWIERARVHDLAAEVKDLESRLNDAYYERDAALEAAETLQARLSETEASLVNLRGAK